MTYYKQICEGYSKKTLMGNWREQRIYPPQPFRETPTIVHSPTTMKTEIVCYDECGAQRTLPKINRRSKWETVGRIILKDIEHIPTTTNKTDFPFRRRPNQRQLERMCFSVLDSLSVPGEQKHSKPPGTDYETTYNKSYVANISREGNPQERQKQVEKNDIQTSLNLNVGIHKIHPKGVKDGYFRHQRDSITMK